MVDSELRGANGLLQQHGAGLRWDEAGATAHPCRTLVMGEDAGKLPGHLSGYSMTEDAASSAGARKLDAR